MIRLAITISLLAFSTLCVQAQPPLEDDEPLREAILPLVSNHRGEVAVAVVHLENGTSYRYRAEMAMPTASLIKLPLMVAVYHAVDQGKVDLATPISLKAEDKVPGSGILTDHFSEGATLSLRDFVRLMIRDSDNTATNIVIDQVGLSATTELMESLGLSNTKLHSKVYRGDTSIFPERSKQFGIGSTTADEMLSLLRLLHEERLGDKASTEEMLQHLATCDDRSKLARDLPGDVKLFHKTGAIGNCRTDAGIVETATGPVALCVLTNKNVDQSWADRNEAELLCAQIGRLVVERFAAEDATTTTKLLQRGTTGLLVEGLQRTLNTRLAPSPELSVDGDFGPATENAVKRFQQAQALEITGRVDAATWQALGPLVEEAELGEPIDAFNSRAAQSAKLPAPAINDPPSVTCKAWVVMDATTGKVLSGWNDDVRRSPASTTKIMTALLVAEAIARDAQIANQIVTFSQQADDTIGSSCGLRVGEQLPVSELLYGLMLPSGNDASVALAEHFGEQFQRELSTSEDKPFATFVARMNLRAKELGMSATHFANPHGLTEPQHQTTASDLARLAFVASQNELLKQLVSTRQRACMVSSLQGYRRAVVWKNTNQLLDIEGYHGMKTGTTEAAGACLVTLGSRAGQSRIVVVLGSSDGQSRYTDSRNLFRWSLSSEPDYHAPPTKRESHLDEPTRLKD